MPDSDLGSFLAPIATSLILRSNPDWTGIRSTGKRIRRKDPTGAVARCRMYIVQAAVITFTLYKTEFQQRRATSLLRSDKFVIDDYRRQRLVAGVSLNEEYSHRTVAVYHPLDQSHHSFVFLRRSFQCAGAEALADEFYQLRSLS